MFLQSGRWLGIIGMIGLMIGLFVAVGNPAVAQPGGSDRDFESIEAVNEAGAAMVFTGQRCFKH